MRPISYRKGTLCLGVPNGVVEAAAGAPEFRGWGRVWAFQLPLLDGKAFVAAGWYYTSLDNPGVIQKGGSVVEALPDWWAGGRIEHAEPWSVTSMFGTGDMVPLEAPAPPDPEAECKEAPHVSET